MSGGGGVRADTTLQVEDVKRIREHALWARDTFGIRGMDGISAANLAGDVILLANHLLALSDALAPFQKGTE